jgi:hypothetical protein
MKTFAHKPETTNIVYDFSVFLSFLLPNTNHLNRFQGHVGFETDFELFPIKTRLIK